MHAGRIAAATCIEGAAHRANQVAGADRIAPVNRRAFEQMAVDAGYAIAMIELDTVTKSTTPAGFDHLACACRINLCPSVVRDIQAIMEHPPGRASPAK